MGVPMHVLAAPLTIQLPVNLPGKATEDSPSSWALDRGSASWILPGPGPITAMGNEPTSGKLSLTLSNK